MSYAPNYSPTVGFATEESNSEAGRSTVRTVAVDTELANISSSINGLNTNLKKLQRDDGKFLDAILEPYALSEQTRALIAASGCNPRGNWQQNTDYARLDIIQYSNIAQICLDSHNSGTVFTQSYWLPISGDGTSAANAAAAAASASSASGSASAASASAAAAAISKTGADSAAAAAAISETNAANSEAAAAALIASSIAGASQAEAEAGTSNTKYMSPLRVAQAIASRSGGYGQTWQVITGSRAYSTTYYNTTGKPIMVLVTNSTNVGIGPTINGTSLSNLYYGSCLFIVPPGQSYSVSSASGTLFSWVELR